MTDRSDEEILEAQIRELQDKLSKVKEEKKVTRFVFGSNPNPPIPNPIQYDDSSPDASKWSEHKIKYYRQYDSVSQVGPHEPNPVNLHILSIDPITYVTRITLTDFDYSGVAVLRSIPGRTVDAINSAISKIPITSIESLIHLAADDRYVNLHFDRDEDFRTYVTYTTTPDISLKWDAKNKWVRVTIANRVGRIYLSGIESFKPQGYSLTDYTLHINDLVEFFEILKTTYPHLYVTMDDTLSEMFNLRLKRYQDTLALITATDAPEIEDNIFANPDFKFRSYQRVAVKFAEILGLKSLISYDMGLGKTAIAFYLAEKHNLRTLFVTKAKLKENVRRELKKLTQKDCVVLAGTKPGDIEMKKLLLEKDKHQYYMINYDIVGRPIRDTDSEEEKERKGKLVTDQIMPWVELINMSQFDLIIFDESHYMKNLDSQRSRGGRGLKAPRTICLTATPIVNGVSDTFALLNIIDRDTFSSFEEFKYQYAGPDGRSIKNQKRWTRLINQYMIRRKKEDVEKDLPAISRLDYYHELSSLARTKYQNLLDGLYEKLRNNSDIHDPKVVNNILESMLRMKQLTADDKVDTSVDLAQEAWEETEKKVIIFSQFKESQVEIANRLGWDKTLLINGDTSEKNLYEYVEKFMNPNSQYKFLSLSTHVGQEGFNLTIAHTIIFNDLMWTPKDHRQAEARAYGRLNDLHGATAYYVQATDTIDEQIKEILDKKLRVIEAGVDNVASGAVESESVVKELIKYLRGGV